MGWKNWPVWIKGGIYAIIINIIFYVAIQFNCSDFYRIGPAYPTNQPICYWLVVNGGWTETAIAVFILGIVIGLIVGKNKK